MPGSLGDDQRLKWVGMLLPDPDQWTTHSVSPDLSFFPTPFPSGSFASLFFYLTTAAGRALRLGARPRPTKFFLGKCGTLSLSSSPHVEGSYLKLLALSLEAGPLPTLQACGPDRMLDTVNAVCEVNTILTLQQAL